MHSSERALHSVILSVSVSGNRWVEQKSSGDLASFISCPAELLKGWSPVQVQALQTLYHTAFLKALADTALQSIAAERRRS